MSVDNPHFSFPFDEVGGHILVRDQGEDDEILDCVEVLLSTEVGERQEVPDYGIPDQTFRMGGADREGILAAVALWVPRATVDIEQTSLEDLIERLRVGVRGRTNA